MSRIGKLPIDVPNGVIITVDPDVISVKGPKGELTVPHLSEVTVLVEGTLAVVTRKNDERISKAQHGLQRTLLNNAVVGVTNGYEKKLEVNGVGFRVSGGKSEIEMLLGFSHPVKYKAVDGINLTVEKMIITVSGIDKQAVGQTAAEIRKLKKPEPYKGKGIKYVDEVLRHKAGKAGKLS
jgi:large subunit ribosomal protein L6